jgi:hypothetical protein
VFTTASRSTLSWARLIRTETSSLPISLRSTLISSSHLYICWSWSLECFTKTFNCFAFLLTNQIYYDLAG